MNLPQNMRVFVGFDHGHVFLQAEIESNDLEFIAARAVELRKDNQYTEGSKRTFVHMIDRLGPEFDRPIIESYLHEELVEFKDFENIPAMLELIKRAQLFFAVELAIRNALAEDGLT